MKLIYILSTLLLISCGDKSIESSSSSDILEQYIKEKNISINFDTKGELGKNKVSKIKRVRGNYEIILNKAYWDKRSECERKVIITDLKSRTGTFGILSMSESLEEQYRIRCR